MTKMKNQLLFLVLAIFSCNTGVQNQQYIKEIVSNNPVTISMREDYLNSSEKKQTVVLNIPVEFQLNLNEKDVRDVRLYYLKDNRQLMRATDYLIYNGENKKPIYAFEDLEYPNYPKSVYIVDRQLAISSEKAEDMLQRYNPKASLSEIKSKVDTIEVVSYKKFREDYPDFIQRMRKQPDSIQLSIGFSKGRTKLVGERINW